MEAEYKHVEGDDNEGSVPIYSSLDNLLVIPSSLSQQLCLKATIAQTALDKWSTNRRVMVKNLLNIANDLDDWEKGCAISTAIGSSVGIASGAAVIGGLIAMPVVAVAGLVVGTIAGASNLVTGLLKDTKSKGYRKTIKSMCDDDTKKFLELLDARESLMKLIRDIVNDDEFIKTLNHNGDSFNKVQKMLGGTVFCASGLGARFAAAQMGRLTSTLVKGVLHAAASVSILIDSITLYFSAKNLAQGSPCQFANEVRECANQLEFYRQKVYREFLNDDVWNNDGNENDS